VAPSCGITTCAAPGRVRQFEGCEKLIADSSGFRAWNFTQGDRGSIIDDGPAVTQEMQLEAITAVGPGSGPATPAGTLILIGSPAVIQP
jgi:hypothetical protein